MVTVLALGAALLYGSADFLGGSATRGAHVLSVLLVSGPAGMAVATVAALLAGGPPRAAGIAWGACAGLAGGVGFIFFYAGLAAGPMSVVAPVSALVSTVLPVTVALADGERPGGRVYAGALICVVAIVLVSTGGGQAAPEISSAAARPGAPGARAASVRAGGTRSAYRTPARHGTAIRGVGYGVVAGLAFGTFFLFIRNGGESGALWPVVVARLAGTLVFLSAAAGVRARPLSWRGDRRLFLAALGAGVLDSSANISYVLATRAGLFGLAIVLTSLYPGITVLLARIVFGEQMHWYRRAGLALAAAGVLLVTV
ncbi:MAG TPA: EamA family transporter [Streptosporangiaceae bacterium]|nr:EamA family transporter [Streptosporangiaceae bacterium]